MVARRLSHHSFSAGVLVWMASSFFRNCVFTAISFADWKMNWPQLGASPFAWWLRLVYFWHYSVSFRGSTYLHHNVAQLILHLLLGALEPLEQIVAHAPLLQQR